MQRVCFCGRLQLFRAVVCCDLMQALAALLLMGQGSPDTYGPGSETQLSTRLARTWVREGHVCVPLTYVGIKHVFKCFSGTYDKVMKEMIRHGSLHEPRCSFQPPVPDTYQAEIFQCGHQTQYPKLSCLTYEKVVVWGCWVWEDPFHFSMAMTGGDISPLKIRLHQFWGRIQSYKTFVFFPMLWIKALVFAYWSETPWKNQETLNCEREWKMSSYFLFFNSHRLDFYHLPSVTTHWKMLCDSAKFSEEKKKTDAPLLIASERHISWTGPVYGHGVPIGAQKTYFDLTIWAHIYHIHVKITPFAQETAPEALHQRTGAVGKGPE